MTRVRLYLRLVACTVRLFAAVITSNTRAMEHVFRDVDGIHLLLGEWEE